MGFYLRKALHLGSLRINLSRSGVGLSAGVTGACFGLDATGQMCPRRDSRVLDAADGSPLPSPRIIPIQGRVRVA
jgi:hypothetical protein